ncbi:MAG TPA: IPT/TIG domain-containing protein [Solirubrobacteraceae bacterium]
MPALRALLLSLLALAVLAPAAVARSPRPRVVHPTRRDVSKPLRAIRPRHAAPRAEEEEDDEAEGATPRLAPPASDPGLQTAAGATLTAPALNRSFEGLQIGDVTAVGAGTPTPPDTTGEVSSTQYVQWVNGAFAVYSRAGARLYGPAAGNTLWAGFGGPCETRNDGDPQVVYDQLAKRWVLSQFAVGDQATGPFYQCLAVSQTSDATGAYYRYAYKQSDTVFNDYPKLAMWPDAYYMGANEFTDVGANRESVGEAAYAFDRAKLLAGQDAPLVRFELGADHFGLQPADLDGTTRPPAGTPETFATLDFNGLALWAMKVDWANPAASTITPATHLGTNPFGPVCSNQTQECLPQPGTAQKLDALSWVVMARLAYRNLGTVQALTFNHNVGTPGTVHANVRWYELRRHTGQAWSVLQQGTYGPGSDNRWMGSAAMDRDGDIGIGYSAGSATTFPSIRYTGRLAGDPLGVLQDEVTLRAGGGAQTGSFRWGDYSTLTVDPVDDCTFWYSTEYYPATAAKGWHTRVGSFRFPACRTVPAVLDFGPASAPVGATVKVYGHNFTGATAVAFGGVPADGFTVVNPGRIDARVPAGAVTAPVSVTTPKGTGASAAPFPVSPTVSSFTPATGPSGTRVTIAGANLAGATAVQFAGVRAGFTVVSPTQITATAPVNAPSGPITVTTPSGTGKSAASFALTSPYIAALSPRTAREGDTVTITGQQLAGATAVRFNNLAATAFTVVSPTQIAATVPPNATTGRLSVTTRSGTATSADTLTVTSAALTGLSPSSAPIGATVTLLGANLTGATAVRFGDTAATFTVNAATRLTATVPAGAASAPVTVVAPAGTATSAATFHVAPGITAVDPTAGPVGTSVAITGTSFSAVDAVRFNGRAAAFTVDSATGLHATVPANATTGRISVSSPEGTTYSASAFTVTTVHR